MKEEKSRLAHDAEGVRAIIFDFDGLILDTESANLNCWLGLYADFDREFPSDRWLDSIGSIGKFDPGEYLCSTLNGEITLEELQVLRRPRIDAIRAGLELMPGVRECVADAKRLNLKLAIASSSPFPWVEAQLGRFDIMQHFDSVACGGPHVAAKPAPDVYELALAMLGVLPHEALALEDSPNGLTAAALAGITCFCVPNPVTRNLDISTAHTVIKSLTDLALERVIADWPRIRQGMSPLAVTTNQSSLPL